MAEAPLRLHVVERQLCDRLLPYPAGPRRRARRADRVLIPRGSGAPAQARSDLSGASSPASRLPFPAKVLNQPRNCRRSAWRRSCLRPPRRERFIEKSLAEDEGLADNLKSLRATLWHVHARATLNAVEPKGEATMMCGKSRRARFALLILASILVGCAKRPQLVQAQAPAPTGAAVTGPAAPVASRQQAVSLAPGAPPM